MLLLSLPSLQPTAAPSCPAAATIRWVDEMVIGLNLCPWATRDSSKGFKLLETDDADDGLDTIALEAANLASRAHATKVWPTTLLVFNDPALDDIKCFATLCRRAKRRIDRTSEEPVALLGFHPARIDSGPGCNDRDVSDAGHYSVRSPFPLLQVLREVDLERARKQWAAQARSGGRGEALLLTGAGDAPVEEAALPGALGLLLENKRTLRRVGSRRLGEMLRLLRSV